MKRWRVVVVVITVAVWVLSVPLAAASDHCMAMGAMCEGPCGASACVVKLGYSDSALPSTAPVPAPPHDVWLSIDLRVLELPPKASLLLV